MIRDILIRERIKAFEERLDSDLKENNISLDVYKLYIEEIINNRRNIEYLYGMYVGYLLNNKEE